MKKPKQVYKVEVVLSLYPSERAVWYVVTLPVKPAEEIYKKYKSLHKGFGSIKVEVKLGKSVWQTSIFRDNSARSYIMFIKASVRKKEQVVAGDTINLVFSIL